MNLLVDANLSWRLERLLKPDFPNVVAVEKTGLPIPATDIDIWDWAKANDFIILTNDEDFFNLLLTKGYPPKVVWLRMGNQRTQNLARILRQKAADIKEFALNKDLGVLEIY